MNKLSDIFFTAASDEGVTYEQILEDVQQYCTANHASELAGDDNSGQAVALLKEFIEQYLTKRRYALEGLTTTELCDKLFEDMAGYSFLKKWIYKPDVEEVNINAYNDIEVIFSGGRSMKIPDKFTSPQQAIDVTRRMLSACGMVIDDTMPSIIGFLDKNIRISVDKTPIVDPEVGIDASIRIVNQQTVSREKLLNSGSATDEMLDFLTACIRYGVSICIAGSTGSGKTTIMAWLLSKVPNNRRLITVEEGSREFNLVKRNKDGEIINSVVHLLTRPHENPSMDIDQSFLLERILRKHPDVIGVGEMRSAKEALAAAEASRTGHTVVTTIHSNSASATYRRMMTLAKIRNAIDDETLMQIMVEAYPVIVFTRQMEDCSRKITEIIEGEDFAGGQLKYRTLYRYNVEDNRIKTTVHTRSIPSYRLEEAASFGITELQDSFEEREVVEVVGRHQKVRNISDTLKKRLLDNGISAKELAAFIKEGD
ncbi:ATPase, T2SS/T4P/T4SS family [Caproicibacter sp. BJN0012]|uniref:ATPase, T2SS/T4P/T4SS family n=1 Tax=Caproicibacter sp. BJN0012 TaxID=3110227 RepID=UPI002E0D5CD8